MHIILIIYFIVFSIEPLLKLPPLFIIGDDLKITYNLSILILLALICVINLAITKIKPDLKNALFIFHGLVAISMLYVLALNPNIFVGALSLAGQLLLISTFILSLSKQTTANGIIIFLNFLKIWAIIHTAFVYVSYFFPELVMQYSPVYLYEIGTKRAFGIMGDQVGWVITFFAFWELYRKKYILYIFYSVAILLTGTLGAVFILLSGSAIYLYQVTKKRIVLVFYGCIFFLLLVMLFANLNRLQNIAVAQRISSEEITGQAGSGAQRLWTYNIAWEMIKEQPIIGHGYGSFSYTIQERFGYNAYFLKYFAGAISNANNQWLQILFEVGLIGLIFYLWMIIYILKLLNRYNDYIPFELSTFKKAGLIWVLCMSFFNHTAVWFLPSWIWIIMSCIIGISIYINRVAEEKISLQQQGPILTVVDDRILIPSSY